MKIIIATVLGLACLAVASVPFHSPGPATPSLFQTTAQAASEQVVAPSSSEFKQRHALFGIECAACHGTDQAVSLPPMTTCFQCHGSYSDVAELTKNLIPDPHHSHMGEVPCGECHKEHAESRLFCNQCHVFEMNVP